MDTPSRPETRRLQIRTPGAIDIENLDGVLQTLLSELEQQPLTPALSLQAGRGRYWRDYYGAVHGSITLRQQSANPPVSRVAMLAPAASAVAAISASNFSIGLSACRRASTISG